MGNHEWCEDCHMSDFHYGLTCEEANPEGRKKVLADKAKSEQERQRGLVLLEELKQEFERYGVHVYMKSDQYIDSIEITGFNLSRAFAFESRPK